MDLAPAIAALEQLNRSQADEFQGAVARLAARRSPLEPAIARGARVYDLATGQVGEVIDARRAKHQIPAA